MNLFSPPPQELFFSRKDPQDPRLGDCVKTTPDQPGVALLGYPDDEGVRLNGGVPGAKAGPDAIRFWLYRMTPHPTETLRPFFDLGNLKFTSDLEQRHADVAAEVTDLLGKRHRVLSLGGGNDYAYADGIAFLRSLQPSERGLILNIDAHLDVRNLDRGFTSGTPFFRLLESSHSFDFCEIGIQTQCNSRHHYEYVKKKGAQILSMDEILGSGQTFKNYVMERLQPVLTPGRPVYLAIDMDAFAFPFAAGTSASWPLGILPHEFYPFLKTLLQKTDVRLLGLYETAPELDTGPGTAKLAAQWAHAFLHEG